MSRRSRSVQILHRGHNLDIVDEFVQSLIESGNYTDTTIHYYRHHCKIILDKLRGLGIEPDPENLTDDELNRLVQYLRRYTVSTQKDYIVPLKMMCEFKQNYVFRRVKIVYPSDTRPNVDWLTYEQCKEILSTWMSPQQEMIVALELLHGLRRIEVVRLKLSDLHEDYMTVTGKGHLGGKLRSIPYHPDFEKSLSRWLKVRNELKWQCNDPMKQPDNLMVYLKGGKLAVYDQIKGSGITAMLKELSHRCGIPFSNHTLRRTFGRELFRSGVSIEVIATLYGHTSTSVTMQYLGLNLDDMTDAMKKMKLRF